MTLNRRRRSGFTLLELVVVIIVLGLLAGIVAPQIIGRLSEAKSTTARTQIELLSAALDRVLTDNRKRKIRGNRARYSYGCAVRHRGLWRCSDGRAHRVRERQVR